jgi:hypothetical protein
MPQADVMVKIFWGFEAINFLGQNYVKGIFLAEMGNRQVYLTGSSMGQE